MTEPLFTVGALVAEPLAAEDAVALKELFAACDGTGELTCGLPAGSPDDPREVHPPAAAEALSIGVFEGEDTAGIVDVFRDVPAPGVWTVGLLMVETGRRGTALGRDVVKALGTWARESGARRLRVGVPAGAEAFWYEAGFEPAPPREDRDTRQGDLMVLERGLDEV
jgi:GNAT superfamily N-acetyltransferase